MIFEKFECFLALFVRRVARLHLGGEEEIEALDPQRQTAPSYSLVRSTNKLTNKRYLENDPQGEEKMLAE